MSCEVKAMETPSTVVVHHSSGSSAWVGPVVVALVFVAIGFWLLDTGRAQHLVDVFNGSKKKTDAPSPDPTSNSASDKPSSIGGVTQSESDGTVVNVGGKQVVTPSELLPV